MSLFVEIPDKDNFFRVVFEDDGKVAYAYLLRNKAIIGDVWLYNQAETPITPEWFDCSYAPFLNSAEFTRESNYSPITDASDICLNWFFKDKEELERVEIFLRKELFAILFPGAKPGWSKLAVKDGPLAKILVTEKCMPNVFPHNQ